jgi:hypothetical protein
MDDGYAIERATRAVDSSRLRVRVAREATAEMRLAIAATRTAIRSSGKLLRRSDLTVGRDVPPEAQGIL